MKRFVALGVAVLLLGTPGCGGPDAAMRELIANINALTEAIERKESRERIQAAADRVRASSDKLDKMKLNDGEKEGLKKKFEKDAEAALTRLKEAIRKVEMEGGADNVPKVEDLFKR